MRRHSTTAETIILDVEGVLFKTFLSTLVSVREGKLARMVEGRKESSPLFIDRDARLFPFILSFLRDGRDIPLPRDEWMLNRIAHEARYFGLSELEKVANQKIVSIGGIPYVPELEKIEEGKELRVDVTSPRNEEYEKADKVEIPLKKSEVEKKLRRKPSLLNRLSISLPRNFAHIAHIGWKGSELILSTSSSSREKDPQMRAMADIASQSSASQVYNLVDGDSSRYGSQGVEVLISSQSIRSLPTPKKAPIPPFRPPPPLT